MYFNTKELSAITISATIWAVINATVGPNFWNLTHLPILCDMLGIATLSLTVWWVRKPGSTAMVGIIATVISLVLNPGGVQFLGFTGAAFVFEALTYLLGYDRLLNGTVVGWSLLLLASFLSATVAGVIIGTFFMAQAFLSTAFGGIAFFTVLHGLGGLVGGVIGVILVKGLEKRITVI